MLNLSVNRVIKNGYISLAFQAFPILAGLILIPINLKAFGNELWGTYVLSINIIFMFLYLSIGINPTINYELPKLLKEKNNHKIKVLLSNGFYVNLFVSLFFGLLIFLGSKFIAYNIYSIQSEEFIKIIKLSALCGSISLMISFFRNVFEAKQEFYLVSLNRVIISVSIFLVPFIFYYQNNLSLLSILSLLIVIYSLVLLTYMIFFFVDFGFLNIKLLNKALIFTLFSFGLWLSLQTLVQQFFVSFDNVIITNFLGIEQLPYYSTVYDLSSRLLIIPTSISAGLVPAISYWLKENNLTQIKVLVNKLYRKIFIIIIPCSIFLIVFSEIFLTLWISKEFSENSYIAFIIIIIAFNFITYSFINFKIIIGYGKPEYFFYMTFFSVLIFAVLSFILISDFGINGVAFSVLIKGIIDCFSSKIYLSKILKF